MHDPISIIMCIVGVVGCVIGVATFVSAQITRAKEDGALMTKVDYLVSGFDELKKDTNVRYNTLDSTVHEHTKVIINLEARMQTLEKEVFHESRQS